MPLRLNPVASTPEGAPSWSSRFGPDHEGTDIFAPEGAPLLAVDDGRVTFGEDPKGGHVVYLLAQDGTRYYYAHASSFEGASIPACTDPPPCFGSSRDVAAGDVVGYVGRTGNACKPDGAGRCAGAFHCHFEVHPNGGPAIDPAPILARATIVKMDAVHAPPKGGEQGGRQTRPVTRPLLAKAMLRAWSDKHGTPADPNIIVWPLAQAITAEGTDAPEYAGTNNVGSYHATKEWMRAHAADEGYGVVAFLDSLPGGAHYIAPMRVYPSLTLGARGMLDLIEVCLGMPIEQIAMIDNYAALLYACGYFGGFHKNVTPLGKRKEALRSGNWTEDDLANIHDYAVAIDTGSGPARDAISKIAQVAEDPSDRTSGPPFATLVERLTVSRPPRTMDHARELLGPNAYKPPGGALSLADSLNSPTGDGVWMFGPGAAPAPKPEGASSSGEMVAALVLGGLALVTFLGLVVYGAQRASRMGGGRVTPAPRDAAAYELAATRPRHGGRRRRRRGRGRRLCPRPTTVQTLILSKDEFSLAGALAWARRNGFDADKVDESGASWRIRQRAPSRFEPGSMRTIALRPGVKAVVGCPEARAA